MYGKIIDAMDDTNFWKVPKFLSLAKISPLSLYLFARMLDHYRFHRDNCRDAEQRKHLKDGWFYWTYPAIQEHVGINKKPARSCIKELKDILLIEHETKQTGLARRCWYRINESTISLYLKRYKKLKFSSSSARRTTLVRNTDDGGTKSERRSPQKGTMVVP